jgi:hypothetical protein
VRRTACIVLLVGAVRAARADDATEVREGSTLAREGGWLELDPVLPPQLEGLGAVEDGERVELELGPDSRLVAEGTWWQNDERARGKDGAPLPHIDVPGRGWGAGLRLSHDFGFAVLTWSGSMNHVDSRYGRGTYVDLGLSLTRKFKLSRWKTAWISLGVGWRQWAGQPPAGEAGSIGVGLTIGTTFK